MVSFYTHLADIGTSTLRFENVMELLKVRNDHLFLSVLASSQCFIITIKSNGSDGVLDVIDMVNNFRADFKHLILIIPRFDESMYKNITINYDVSIEHMDEGNFHILISYVMYNVLYIEPKHVY